MKISQLLIGLVAGVLSLAALAEEPIVIKFSHVVAIDTPKGKAAEMFAKKTLWASSSHRLAAPRGSAYRAIPLSFSFSIQITKEF